MKKEFLLASLILLTSPLTLKTANADNDDHHTYSSESLHAAKSLSKAFENVAKTLSPSVVNVSTTSKAQVDLDGLESPFKEFFGERFFERFKEQGDTPKQGLGTGVIIDSNGHILTNHHVVGDADKVEIRFLDNDKGYQAEVVGKDPATDLAVLKVQGAPSSLLQPAKLGSSDNLKIGEWVVAIGNPFGLDHSITAGIVSAKGRSLMMPDRYEDFIQTDAAINPGNSGGPLVNLSGEVVGINSAIFSRSGGYMGIGFAIPSAIAKSVSESLINQGRVVRGWLGVTIQNLSEELAKSFGVDTTKGVLVGQVQTDSPADTAGLKQGDIIVGVSGKNVEDVNQLKNKIAGTKPGTTVSILVIRGGNREAIDVKIAELPSDISSILRKPGKSEPNKNDALKETIGIIVQDITEELAASLDLGTSEGVIVAKVSKGSPAYEGGLRSRDIIKKVGETKVSSVSELLKLLSDEVLKIGVRLIVEQQGMERFVFIKIDE